MIIPELLFKVVLESKFPMLFKIVVIFETDSFFMIIKNLFFRYLAILNSRFSSFNLSFKNFEIKIKRLFEIRLL